MASRTRTCWKCGEEIGAKGPVFELQLYGRYYNPPERLLRLCEKCWKPVELALEQTGYEIRKTLMAGRRRACWKCGKAIGTEGPVFEFQRFGRSYNHSERLLRLCEECWRPIEIALKQVGYVVQEAHTVDIMNQAREEAVAVHPDG